MEAKQEVKRYIIIMVTYQESFNDSDIIGNVDNFIDAYFIINHFYKQNGPCAADYALIYDLLENKTVYDQEKEERKGFYRFDERKKINSL